MQIEDLITAVSKPKIWNTEPVFCFTTDIDWASETVLKIFYEQMELSRIWPHTFVTHKSDVVDSLVQEKKIETGIHPNFLQGSSHGDSFIEVIENCLKIVSQSWIYRSHRAFSVTDTSHLLKEKYGHKASSNVVTILQENIQPILHESGMIEFPIFFEDGTHLYNKLDLNINRYIEKFTSPGIKIINMHPMNFVINPSTINYMRSIKDTLSREAYNNLSYDEILKYRNKERGIADLCIEVINLSKNFRVVKLSELYNIAVN
jgi:hypothetical protein